MSKNQSSPFLNRYPLSGPIFILIGILLITYFVYKYFFASGNQGMMTPPPPSVTIVTVKSEDTPVFYEYSGRVAGKKAIEIRPRVSGTILKRNYVEGTYVKKGAVLFVIDPAPFEASLAQAQAKARQTQRDWVRAKKLFTENALSSKEHDAALSAYEQAEADLKIAKINLGYTTVKAPISGITSKEALSEGNLVAADSTLLTYLTETESLYVNFSIPDSEMMEQRSMIEKGTLALPADKKLKAEISHEDGKPYTAIGTVDFTDSIIDTQTGTVQSRAIISNTKHNLLPGMFIRIKVKGFTRNQAIAIPDKAVMQGPQGTFVYGLSAENTATIKPVVLGMLIEGSRFIEQGLTPGDRIITEGMIKVKPNAPVQIDVTKTSPQTPGASEPAGKKG